MNINVNRGLFRTGILFFTFLFFGIQANSQTRVCEGENVTIRIEGYRGIIQWERSYDYINWELLIGETNDSINLIATDSIYFRASLTEGSCEAFYADVCSLFVYPEVDILLAAFDTVCIESEMFDLTGGSPDGGIYTGHGVFDGRFIPTLAGAGDHTIHYTFQYEGSECIYTDSSVLTVLPSSTIAYAGEDTIIVVSDSIELNANTAVTGTGEWSIISGLNGSFNNINDPKSIYRGGNGEHLLVWTISSECGYSSDTVQLLFIETYGPTCPGIPIVTDRDGNIYPTVQIGNRCWMAKNLKTGIFIRSDNTRGYHSDASNNGIIEKYCFDNEETNCDTYGGLYDWNELMNYGTSPESRGICPEGWHIPSFNEWDELDANFALRQSGKAIKEGGSTGFEGQLAGDRHANGNFYGFNASGFFWTSTQYNSTEAWFREICYCNDYVDSEHGNKFTGMSVRCIKDN